MEDYLLEGVLHHFHGLSGFDSMRCVAIEPGRVVMKSKAHSGLENIYGNVHGGSIMTLVDMTASAAGYSLGKHVITLSSNTNFVRALPINNEDVKVVSEVVHNGKSTMIVETKIYDGRGKVCVRNTTTMYVPKLVHPEDPILKAPAAYDANFLAEGE
ncbi:MAG: PaaI family thioesterase [Coriobacteriia bacterium]|nr:PaaI family thioesterase [Coriobacteriia bacterium]